MGPCRNILGKASANEGRRVKGKGMHAFFKRLDSEQVAVGSLVCVGLDPDPKLMPVRSIFDFNRAIVDATAGQVCAYKPQLAWYEAQGLPGIAALEKTVEYIRSQAPDILIIGDAKRGDIGAVASAYAKALFEVWGFDAATVNPYQGIDTINPFLRYPGKGIFVVCRTSNPSSGQFQDLQVQNGTGPTTLYGVVAEAAESWGQSGNVGIVVGATAPDELRLLRRDHPGLTMLIPGVGAQGGDVWTAIDAGINHSGRGMVINSSRGIIYASDRRADFAQAARDAVERLNVTINSAVEETLAGRETSNHHEPR